MSAVLAAVKEQPLLLLVPILLLWNLVTFAITGFDKLRAKRGWWRTPERTLTLFSVFGGGVGTLLAFYLFRHKTRHTSLLVPIWIFTVLWVAGLGYLFYRLMRG